MDAEQGADRGGMSALNIEDRARIIVKFNAAGQLVARPAARPTPIIRLWFPAETRSLHDPGLFQRGLDGSDILRA